LAGGDAPVRNPAVEILPELLAELGLRAVELKDRSVGFDPRHDPAVCGVGNSTRLSPRAKRDDPLLEARSGRYPHRSEPRKRCSTDQEIQCLPAGDAKS